MRNFFPFLSERSGARIAIEFPMSMSHRPDEDAALAASEERYRELAEQLVDGFIITDDTGRPLDANRSACDLFGYSLDELRTLSPADLLSGEELPEVAPTIQRLSRSEVLRKEFRFTRKDGSLLIGEVLGRKLADGRLQAVIRDVTEARQTEEVQRRLHQLALLPHTGAIEDMLGAILDIAMSVTQADFGNIQLFNENSSQLRITVQRGFPQRWLDHWQEVSHGRGACGSALTGHERVIVEDVERSPMFTATDLRMHREAGVRAVQSTRLLSRSAKVIGMLSTHWRRPCRPDAAALRVLDRVAGEVVSIIEHAQTALELTHRAALLDLAHNAIFVRDADGRVTYWNEGACRYYGWRKEEALGNVSNVLLQTAFPEPLGRIIDTVRRTGYWEGELVHTARDGRRVVVDSRWAIQPDTSGSGYRILEINNDITRHKESESALRESEQRLQSYITQAADAIYELDGDTGRILSANNRAIEMLGYSCTELLQLSAADIERAHTPGMIHDVLEMALQKTVEVEGEHRRKDGAVFPVEIRLTALPGPLHRILSIVRDISERKRVENERVEEARRKDEFLAFLGHELRNPLAAISTAMQVLSSGPPAPARARMEEIVTGQTAMMRRLVDDLLELERITHGRIELKTEWLDLATCLRRAIGAVQATVASREQELVLRLPSEPVALVADGTRLEQIVGNLLTNASKYTERGGRVELSGWREGGNVVIRCTDNGRGVPREFQTKIFEPFVRQPGIDLGSGEASLGLGLALVKQLTELHGGTIAVESEGAGRGSEFTVRLPLADSSLRPDAVASAQPSAATSRRTRRIVIVEDNPIVAAALEGALQLAGHTVHLCSDGPGALAADAAVSPDVFLIDIGLPGMDGYELATALKRRPGASGALLVALSGTKRRLQGDPDRRDDFDHYFTKPVDLQPLLTLIDGQP